jgi:DNA ligase-1
VQGTAAFRDRLAEAGNYCDGKQIIHLPHNLISNLDELLAAEEAALALGYEGVMVRHPRGPYKFGRATQREGWLLKVKRKQTSEALIIGFQEQMHNANELKTDELGYAERSSHQANLVPTGVLGAFTVRDKGVEFNVGTGFTFQDRQEFWRKRHELIGSRITYEYLPIGVKDKPRHPVFKGFRPQEDA